MAGGSQVRNPIPPKNREAGLVHVKSVGGQMSSRCCGAKIPTLSWHTQEGPLLWCGSLERSCQLECRPRQLTTVQNYEVSPKIALVLLLNGA
ncbi:hypothetical protein AVEN_95374-1 [Araneus ventricosus]|uniref:Uncharacterized protein n=1 Tax=Araneus ventricosus TaxID=182803 RepID=A0A4Y2CGD8_ARAVE|nr:hypothetical protein AVEN_95374-1 [Araneus ventricosus]